MSGVSEETKTEWESTVNDYITNCGYSEKEAITATRILFNSEEGQLSLESFLKKLG